MSHVKAKSLLQLVRHVQLVTRRNPKIQSEIRQIIGSSQVQEPSDYLCKVRSAMPTLGEGFDWEAEPFRQVRFKQEEEVQQQAKEKEKHKSRGKNKRKKKQEQQIDLEAKTNKGVGIDLNKLHKYVPQREPVEQIMIIREAICQFAPTTKDQRRLFQKIHKEYKTRGGKKSFDELREKIKYDLGYVAHQEMDKAKYKQVERQMEF